MLFNIDLGPLLLGPNCSHLLQYWFSFRGFLHLNRKYRFFEEQFSPHFPRQLRKIFSWLVCYHHLLSHANHFKDVAFTLELNWVSVVRSSSLEKHPESVILNRWKIDIAVASDYVQAGSEAIRGKKDHWQCCWRVDADSEKIIEPSVSENWMRRSLKL